MLSIVCFYALRAPELSFVLWIGSGWIWQCPVGTVSSAHRAYCVFVRIAHRLFVKSHCFVWRFMGVFFCCDVFFPVQVCILAYTFSPPDNCCCSLLFLLLSSNSPTATTSPALTHTRSPTSAASHRLWQTLLLFLGSNTCLGLMAAWFGALRFPRFPFFIVCK